MSARYLDHLKRSFSSLLKTLFTSGPIGSLKTLDNVGSQDSRTSGPELVDVDELEGGATTTRTKRLPDVSAFIAWHLTLVCLFLGPVFFL